jgi:predicted transcriptional regulator of viral defense system
MSTDLQKYLADWPKPYIRDQDLQPFFLNVNPRRYDAVKYAIRKGYLLVIKRGLYLIKLPFKKQPFDPFEIAQAIYGPSYISLESALSFYGWIPEAVYTMTSVSTRRSKEFNTPIGVFTFRHIPYRSHLFYFYEQVNRIESQESVFLIADPWKALADYIYVYKKEWPSIKDLYLDMRIERETLTESNTSNLEKLAKGYSSKRVRTVLSNFLKDLKHDHGYL